MRARFSLATSARSYDQAAPAICRSISTRRSCLVACTRPRRPKSRSFARASSCSRRFRGDQARRVRGGAGGIEAPDDAGEEEEEEQDEDDEDFFGDEDNAFDEEEFGEETWLGRTRQAWVKTPLITRSFFRVRARQPRPASLETHAS